ncbi:MAG TPA: aminoacyl-tRNA hydrolase [Ruminococcus sp.]
MSIFDLFDKISTQSSGGKVEYVIVGLGNPGLQYENTRHNAGFMTIDKLAESLGVKIDKMKFKGLYADADINGKRCILLKPTTYMNNSGESVTQVLNFYKLSSENLIVIYDDISLEPGKLRIRRKGSHGGHNGMRSIIDLLGTDEFIRVKVGVGKKPHPDYNLADWVLGHFTKEQMNLMNQSIENASEAVKLIVQNKVDEAMNKYN